MHGGSQDMVAFDKRVCSCLECASWSSPAVSWRNRTDPKHGRSVAYRGRFWWDRGDGYYATGPSHSVSLLLHREIWRVHDGAIPPGHDIHHRDKDRRNNQLANLELLNASEHAIHHGTPEGFFVHKHAEFERRCRYCGKVFILRKPTRAVFCGDWCRRADRRENRVSQAKPRPILVCLICGTSFEAKRGDAKYCSRRCSTASQDRAAYGRAYYLAHPEKWASAEKRERRNTLRRLQRAARSGK